jgi:hypothetical protein
VLYWRLNKNDNIIYQNAWNETKSLVWGKWITKHVRGKKRNTDELWSNYPEEDKFKEHTKIRTEIDVLEK